MTISLAFLPHGYEVTNGESVYTWTPNHPWSNGRLAFVDSFGFTVYESYPFRRFKKLLKKEGLWYLFKK